MGAVRRDIWSIVALLVALMLPLQSFAAAAHCDPAQHSPAASHEHCAQHEHAPSLQHHSCCPDCCVTAVVVATAEWTLPHTCAHVLFLPASHMPLTTTIDRLDRPPRQFT
jgi:hypothetical protein